MDAHRARVSALVLAGSCAGVLWVGERAEAAPRQELTLVVHVNNQALIESAVLGQAQAQVNWIFRDIGVRIVWSDIGDGPYEPACEGFSVLVSLLPDDPVRQHSREAPKESVLGSAVRTPGRAKVYPGRLRALAERTRGDYADLLGRAIAHEIGHLLLPPGHSQRGIMTASLETSTTASVRFTGPEPRAIRALLGSKAGNLQEQLPCGN